MATKSKDEVRQAFRVVFDLAWDNALDERECIASDELEESMREQHAALMLAEEWLDRQLNESGRGDEFGSRS